MIIEVRGTGTRNKGAQLMLEAVVERLGGSTLLTAPAVDIDSDVRSRLGLYTSMEWRKVPLQTSIVTDRIPDQLITRYRFASERNITGAVDASGFKYSDSFPLNSIQKEVRVALRRKNNGTPIVLLPQAFGPFLDKDKRDQTRTLLNSAAYVFVRDLASAAHLEELGVSTPVERCPDFTIGLSPLPVHPLSVSQFMAIVPNLKMVSRGTTTVSEYMHVLNRYAESAKGIGLETIVVIHEMGDREFGVQLANDLNARWFTDPNPRVLKAALGQASLIVTSRFHAAVGGLSQGVPTIALGWSHKYLELLRDFGVEQWTAAMHDNPVELINNVLADSIGIESIRTNKTRLVDEVSRMWTKTESILRSIPRQE